MKRYLKEGEMIAPFYGIAYIDYERKCTPVCYPLGINLIVMLWRDWISWIKFPKQGK